MSLGGEDAPASSTLRAQSEIVGIVLVFSLVIGGATAIVVIGSQTISETQGELTQDRAEKTMTQLAGKASLVALGQSDSQSVDVPDPVTYEDDGRLQVRVTNWTSGSTTTVVDKELGALVSKGYAYQSGGVFTKDRFISPPEFHYREGTLTLPVINVSGSPGNRATVVPDQTREVDIDNPLDNHYVEVVVTSEYYRGWGQYFEERTTGGVTYDHPNNTVILQLQTPFGQQTIDNAALATVGDLEIGGTSTRTDSYNSSEGAYDPTNPDDRGNVTVAGDFVISGDISFSGDAYVGGQFECNGGGSVQYDGDVYWVEGYNPGAPNCHIGGDTEIDEDQIEYDTTIRSRVRQMAETSSGEPAPPISSGTVTAGTYYVDGDLTLDGSDDVTIDTSSGPVRIVVNKSFEMVGDARIEVTGPQRFQVYVNGSEMNFEKQGSDAPTVTTSGPVQRAPDVWFYGDDEIDITVDSTAAAPLTIEGVLYAPDGVDGTPTGGATSTVTVDGAEIYGAVVGGDVDIATGNDGQVHYDEALGDEQPVPPDTLVPTINYLQITVSEITAD